MRLTGNEYQIAKPTEATPLKLNLEKVAPIAQLDRAADYGLLYSGWTKLVKLRIPLPPN